jgi:hypothetical protein
MSVLITNPWEFLKRIRKSWKRISEGLSMVSVLREREKQAAGSLAG